MRRFFTRLWITVCVFFLLTEVAYWSYYILSPRVSGKDYLEKLMAPSYRVAAEELTSGIVTVAQLEERFGFPVTQVAPAALSHTTRGALSRGGGYTTDWQYAWRERGDSEGALRFGPLPRDELSSHVLISLVIFVDFSGVAAGALYLLMRQTRGELEALEAVATQMSNGDWLARAPDATGGATETLAFAFNRMAENTNALIESQRELLRATSHELRTPIARLQTGMHILSMKENSKERSRRLEGLDQDFAELSDLVDELLTYSRFEGSLASELPKGSFKPAGELERLERQYAQEAAARGMQVTADHSVDDLNLVGDVHLLRRVVGNLLGNAVRHSNQRVEIKAANVAGDLQLTVDDDGPGIPAADRQRVFDPFVRLEPGIAGGHGVGLAIAKRVATAVGGDVRADDSPWGGCRIAVRWPSAPSDEKLVMRKQA